MATIAGKFVDRGRPPDVLSGTPRAHAIDRWIYVFMAALLIVVTLTGFIPDSIEMVSAVRAGTRPPLPPIMHVHAVLMASFLLLLLAQTVLVATGRCAVHRRLGLVAMVLAPALVIVGLILAPTMYHQTWDALQTAPAEARERLLTILTRKENILLFQLRIGTMFALFLTIGLLARGRNAGLHKRMMILATVMALPAGIDRIPWLPTTLPASPVATDLWILLVVSPMFLWDVIRNRRVHEAYWIWLGVNVPVALLLYTAWDKPWWHVTARSIMGV